MSKSKLPDEDYPPQGGCTAACEVRECWLGGQLLWRQTLHRHGGPVEWGAYDAHSLGMACAHVDETCPARRGRFAAGCSSLPVTLPAGAASSRAVAAAAA